MVGIPNLVCGCILGWRSVVYHFWVTLTFDFVSSIIVLGAYLLFSLLLLLLLLFICFFWVGGGGGVGNPNLELDAHHFWVTLTLTSDLVSRIIVPRAYLLYYFR